MRGQQSTYMYWRAKQQRQWHRRLKHAAPRTHLEHLPWATTIAVARNSTPPQLHADVPSPATNAFGDHLPSSPPTPRTRLGDRVIYFSTFIKTRGRHTAWMTYKMT